jgi:mRNA interferase RelE/StbE
VTYSIRIAPAALKMLEDISDRRVRSKLIETIDRLAEEPDKQGKPLGGELSGYRSLRAVGQRYRIIYRVEGDLIIVFIVAIGLRKERSKSDIYNLAKKLLRQGLVDLPKQPRKRRGKRN